MLVDIGVNLMHRRFDADREAVVLRCFAPRGVVAEPLAHERGLVEALVAEDLLHADDVRRERGELRPDRDEALVPRPEPVPDVERSGAESSHARASLLPSRAGVPSQPWLQFGDLRREEVRARAHARAVLEILVDHEPQALLEPLG